MPAAVRKSSVGSDEPRVYRAPRPAIVLYRTAAVFARAFANRTTPEVAIRELYGTSDPATAALTRAASTQATTTDATWAGQVAQAAVDDSLAAMTALSAGAELITRGRKIDMTGIAHLTVPGRVVSAAAAGAWVKEGQPAPVRSQAVTAGAVLEPRKLGVISVFTTEIAASSNVEDFSRAVISESAALALDAAMFSTNVDDGAHPAGLMYNVAPLTPTAGGGLSAFEGDVKQLYGALASAGAGLSPVLVCSAQQAGSIKVMAGPKFDVPVLSSAGLAAGVVVLVEPSSFVSGFNSVPEFEASRVSLLHMEDATPQNITGGSPSPAVPAKSMWQTDSFALKMILRASWSMRAPHVAWLQGATW